MARKSSIRGEGLLPWCAVKRVRADRRGLDEPKPVGTEGVPSRRLSKVRRTNHSRRLRFRHGNGVGQVVDMTESPVCLEPNDPVVIQDADFRPTFGTFAIGSVPLYSDWRTL